MEQLINNFEAAVKKLTRAKLKFEQMGNQYAAAQCLQMLGDIDRMQNNFEAAVEKLTSAKLKFEQIGNLLRW
ncbi:hypothetical protein AX16_001578 [Volvariella volvacea WC 439]|nr:hypothetical protein AX16_001578 [Volvariella volvacea WC 439]